MDNFEIRVHPKAAAYMETLAYCIEAATPLVQAGCSYLECEDAIRAATMEVYNRTGIPAHNIETFTSIVQTAFKILSKKEERWLT